MMNPESPGSEQFNTPREHRVFYLPMPSGKSSDAPDERAIHEARYTENGIDVRVDWDGSDDDPGRFEVLNASGVWVECPHTAPSDARNDVMHTTKDVSGRPFLVRFQRGPAGPAVRFEVKLLPVVGLGDLSGQSSEYVAVRGQDYEYEGEIEPALVSWTPSSEVDGAHGVTVMLVAGKDYEVWVKLSHPTDPNRSRILDPLVRGGNAGGGQEPT
ncbi:hypothetical protein Hoch_1261 [Haliangium ochraceum DSM 14365]|uniref:Uncharacterized protein n=1 Tax=Haliangium ochraceum (strain DSM 14365 / JCM 11303 / SMP-2) TaxID=502025 RepID=D0LTC6_HALO1|nr:hypothetical protein Hoch_1261 [Haliangium ochraceum DSM 14365]